MQCTTFKRQRFEVPLHGLGITVSMHALLSFGFPRRGSASGMYPLLVSLRSRSSNWRPPSHRRNAVSECQTSCLSDKF